MIEKISKVSAASFWAFVVMVMPFFVSAGQQQTGGIKNLVNEAGGLIQGLIPIVIGLGVLVFLWGILRYVLASDDAGKAQGRQFMLWGIIALFVMVSVWGLVNILRETLRLNPATPNAPAIPRVGR